MLFRHFEGAALESLTTAPQSWVPVLDDERRVIGTLSISDVVRAYRQELVFQRERISDLGVTTGAAHVTVTADSAVVGKTLRHADFPFRPPRHLNLTWRQGALSRW